MTDLFFSYCLDQSSSLEAEKVKLKKRMFCMPNWRIQVFIVEFVVLLLIFSYYPNMPTRAWNAIVESHASAKEKIQNWIHFLFVSVDPPRSGVSSFIPDSIHHLIANDPKSGWINEYCVNPALNFASDVISSSYESLHDRISF